VTVRVPVNDLVAQSRWCARRAKSSAGEDAKSLADILEKVKQGVRVHTKDILKVAKLFDDEVPARLPC